MKQKYEMPAVTEEQRQELIELCEAVLAGHVQYGGDSNEEDIYKIALAALTAEKRLTVSVVQKNERLKGFNFEGYDSLPAGEHEFYTAPPAPVFRLPDEADTSHLPFAAMAWNACLAEVKRLNNQPAPPEASNEQ